VDVRVRLRKDFARIPPKWQNCVWPGRGRPVRRSWSPGKCDALFHEHDPSEINRQDLTRQVVITANLDDLPLGTAVEKVRKAAEKIQMAPGYRVVFTARRRPRMNPSDIWPKRLSWR